MLTKSYIRTNRVPALGRDFGRRRQHEIREPLDWLDNWESVPTGYPMSEPWTESSWQTSTQDGMLVAIQASLARLSAPRSIDVVRRILEKMPADGWRESALHQWPEWNKDSENLVLLVLGAGCRVGWFFHEDGRWCFTPLGREVAPFIIPNTAIGIYRENWDILFRQATKASVRWAWSALLEAEGGIALSKLTANAVGWNHEEIVTGIAFDSADPIRYVAAAAALDAVWFSGWRWEPTLQGAWLSRHRSSPLHRAKER